MKKRIISLFVSLIMMFSAVTVILAGSVSASNVEINISGKEYTFEENSDYLISEAISNRNINNAGYGRFSINGDAVKGNKAGIESYAVNSGNLTIYYKYSDDLLLATGEKVHLVSDDGKKVNGEKTPEKIKKGLVWLQISRDRINWITVKQITDAFERTPNETDALYETNDIEIINGCYYRLTVAYKTEQQTGTKKGVFGKEKPVYEYKKKLEIYEFYAYNPEASIINSNDSNKFRLGETVKVEHEGYYKTKVIDNKDVHYAWKIGEFFVSGYTAQKGDKDNPVFLKNVGDKVVLWFNLKQNIDKLNDNSKLSILYDSAGYDKELETPKTEFGRGTLIIRKTDHQNIRQEPVIYTNYLEANTSLGADTKVQLFEEGDYEVSLDYGITNDKLIDKYSYYKVSFKFKIRNGNCSIHLMDLGTGSELPNTAFTSNGFEIDLAGSKYLKVYVKKEVLKTGAEGLTEDPAFNQVSSDGKKYSEEGIYTITVVNEYVEEPTIKRIYVGNDSVLRAYIVTGKDISEIRRLVAEGATINDDGSILISSSEVVTGNNNETDPVIESTTLNNQTEPDTTCEETTENSNRNTGRKYLIIVLIVLIVLVIVLACIVVLVLIINNKKKHNK